MCAIDGDGAAALLVCSRSYLKKCGPTHKIKIIASVIGSGSERDIDDESMGEHLSKKATDCPLISFPGNLKLDTL